MPRELEADVPQLLVQRGGGPGGGVARVVGAGHAAAATYRGDVGPRERLLLVGVGAGGQVQELLLWGRRRWRRASRGRQAGLSAGAGPSPPAAEVVEVAVAARALRRPRAAAPASAGALAARAVAVSLGHVVTCGTHHNLTLSAKDTFRRGVSNLSPSCFVTAWT